MAAASPKRMMRRTTPVARFRRPGAPESTMAHGGVALDDARNAAVLGFLAPFDFSSETAVRERLTCTLLGASAARINEVVGQIMRRPNPPVPVSQSLQEVADPLYGLGTHPDLITRLWALDDQLPQRCRWVVYGKPALVHPTSGIVFGFAAGTLGYALRLPEPARRQADALGAKTVVRLRYKPPWDVWDVGRAGPEWRLGRWSADEPEWCSQAFDEAGERA